MAEGRSERREGTPADADVLEEMLRIAEKSSPYSPYFDNIHGYKELGEIRKTQDWAQQMERCGHSVSRIRLNLDERGKLDDPPDVLAEVDGKAVGVEVTDLLEYPKRHTVGIATADGGITTLTWKQRRNGSFDFHWHGSEIDPEEKAKREREVEANPELYKDWVEWPLERFQARLADIVRTKDEKAGAKRARRVRLHGDDALDHRLQGSLLLIFTPELYLRAHLAEYLEETELSRPENFDRVFLMGHCEPGKPRGRHPVFEVRLNR